jgi:hypothetical protein
MINVAAAVSLAIGNAILLRKLDPGELFRRRWHGRRMMIDNEPTLATLDVSEAVTRRQALGLAVR